jgi:hypothetical protein
MLDVHDPAQVEPDLAAFPVDGGTFDFDGRRRNGRPHPTQQTRIERRRTDLCKASIRHEVTARDSTALRLGTSGMSRSFDVH